MTLDLRDRIRDVPDFPTEGVVFKDLMPLIADPEYFAETIHRLADWARPREPELILGAEARMNMPGSADANWCWRLTEDQLNTLVFQQLRDLTASSNRLRVSQTVSAVKIAKPAA